LANCRQSKEPSRRRTGTLIVAHRVVVA
jgi:hypothetical protein